MARALINWAPPSRRWLPHRTLRRWSATTRAGLRRTELLVVGPDPGRFGWSSGLTVAWALEHTPHRAGGTDVSSALSP